MPQLLHRHRTCVHLPGSASQLIPSSAPSPTALLTQQLGGRCSQVFPGASGYAREEKTCRRRDVQEADKRGVAEFSFCSGQLPRTHQGALHLHSLLDSKTLLDIPGHQEVSSHLSTCPRLPWPGPCHPASPPSSLLLGAQTDALEPGSSCWPMTTRCPSAAVLPSSQSPVYAFQFSRERQLLARLSYRGRRLTAPKSPFRGFHS